MLGENIDKPGFGWPTCGEVDIMENFGTLTLEYSTLEHSDAYFAHHSVSWGGKGASWRR